MTVVPRITVIDVWAARIDYLHINLGVKLPMGGGHLQGLAGLVRPKGFPTSIASSMADRVQVAGGVDEREIRFPGIAPTPQSMSRTGKCSFLALASRPSTTSDCSLVSKGKAPVHPVKMSMAFRLGWRSRTGFLCGELPSGRPGLQETQR